MPGNIRKNGKFLAFFLNFKRKNFPKFSLLRIPPFRIDQNRKKKEKEEKTMLTLFFHLNRSRVRTYYTHAVVSSEYILEKYCHAAASTGSGSGAAKEHGQS